MKYVLATALTLAPLAAMAQAPTMPTPSPGSYYTKRVIPPAEYDVSFPGKLIEIRIDAILMDKICPKTSFPVTLGCAITTPDKSECLIVLAHDPIIKKAGW